MHTQSPPRACKSCEHAKHGRPTGRCELKSRLGHPHARQVRRRGATSTAFKPYAGYGRTVPYDGHIFAASRPAKRDFRMAHEPARWKIKRLVKES